MFKRLCAFAGCLVLLACAASPAKGGVIFFNNTGNTEKADLIVTTFDSVGQVGWLAQAFTPTANVNLNVAKFLMWSDEPDALLRINLYNSVGGVPGAVIQTIYPLQKPGVILHSSPGLTVPGLDIPLSAGIQYFLAAEVTAKEVYWQYTVVPGAPTLPAGPSVINYGTGWTAQTGYMQMQLEGTAVPEPCTFALVGVASGCWWCVGRFRRRKKSDVAAC